MICRFRSALWKATLALVAIALGGCASAPPKGPHLVKVSPVQAPQVYGFLKDDPTVGRYFNELYHGEAKPFKLDAYISEPIGYTIAFEESVTDRLAERENAVTFRFQTGVYPFSLQLIKSGKKGEETLEQLSGAIAVFNLDKVVELVSLGYTDQTKFFSLDLLEKVRAGALASATISFEGQPRLVYWLGNRAGLFPGGDPTVELDFSGTTGLVELTVNDKKIKGLRATVPVYRFKKLKKGGREAELLEHTFTVKLSSGAEYRGYIRDLKDNPFTAFMKVPCTIPAELFAAADRGTIPKLTISSGGPNKTDVAVLVFGSKK